MRVLVVEDEAHIRRALSANLTARGFEVLSATNGEEALRLAVDRTPSLILLDLGLPGIDGLEVLHGLRGWTNVPIIVLTVRSDEADRVQALDAGADDFLTKPFGMGELLARVRAVLRRAGPAVEAAVIEAGDLTIDLADHRVRRDGTDIHLTPIEWRILEMLVRHRDRLVTQRALLQTVWGPGFETETNYLRVHLTNLRRKIENPSASARHVVTEPGVGYRFVSEPGLHDH